MERRKGARAAGRRLVGAAGGGAHEAAPDAPIALHPSCCTLPKAACGCAPR
jgi:hypothetical protein